ncbi:MAG: hypothetical protein MZV63_17200 [Marinilabiliales bacterium]|nr:hypothetical protein [Marinilabiliales bacterium]
MNQTTQILQLGINGIAEVSRLNPKHSVQQKQINGNPVSLSSDFSPVLWFDFNEGIGDIASERITKAGSIIPGHKTLWKKEFQVPLCSLMDIIRLLRCHQLLHLLLMAAV